jgi:hypothetical protein
MKILSVVSEFDEENWIADGRDIFVFTWRYSPNLGLGPPHETLRFTSVF